MAARKKTAKKKKAGKRKGRKDATRPVGVRRISPEALAQFLGVSRQAVLKAIRTGRLSSTTAAKNDRGWWRIDGDRAVEEWKAATDPSLQRKRKAGGAPRLEGTGSMFDPNDKGGAGARAEPHDPAAGTTHALASARKTDAQAALAELELRRRVGELVDADGTRRGFFHLARQVRDRLMVIPDRVCNELAAEDKPRKVHARLIAELTTVLAELAGPAPADV